MNNKDFINELSKRTGLSNDLIQKNIHVMLDFMNDDFEQGNPVTIQDFGTFEVKKKMERIVVNPSTQQRMLVPPKLVLNFKPVAKVKEKVKNARQNHE